MESMTKQGIEKKYNSRHATDVLTRTGYIEFMPREKGKHTRFQILKDLPELIDFKTLYDKVYTYTISGLIEDACSELEGLKDELQEWYDSLPESFQNGDKGSTLQDTISTLENIQEPDIPCWVAEETTVLAPSLSHRTGRAHRRDCATDKLHAVVDWVETYKIEHADISEDQESDLDAIVGEIEQIISEAECVEFPGMYS